MRRLLSKFKLAACAGAVVVVLAIVPSVNVAASSPPTGEVVTGHSQLEPAYDDLSGNLMYLLTPLGTPLVDPANQQHATAPLYIIVYPTAVATTIGVVNCQHQPMDNCPDHGPEIAGFAKASMPGVYGTGVWGHDHIGTGHPSAPPKGGDYNTAWVPTVVLFKSLAAATNHIITLSQLNAAIAAGQVTVTPLPGATFQCSPVSVRVYDMGTPVVPAPPLP